MEYLTSPEMSEKWGISSRRVSLLCAEGRIAGAIKKREDMVDSIKRKKNQKMQEEKISERVVSKA